MPLKAWIVEEPIDGQSEIVFAPTRGRAIVTSDFYGWCDFVDLKARRAARYDTYSEQGEVPKEVLLQDGWWFTCEQERCSKRVYGDSGIVIDGRAYCAEHSGLHSSAQRVEVER